VRVWVQYKEDNSGKSKFLRRLMPALKKIGVECRTSKKGCDVALGIIYWRKEVPKMPRVLRCDGIWLLNLKSKRLINRRMAKAIKQSHSVIWQSQYCRDIGRRFLGVRPTNEYVIGNGVDPKDYDVKPMDSPYAKNVIMSSLFRGRPQKGLKRMYMVARQYSAKHPDVGFWIAGKVEDGYKSSRNIKFLGQIGENKLRRYLKMADVMLYLVTYDWCPNALVEGIGAGLSIVYSTGSGVEELAKGCGIGVELKNPVVYKLLSKRPKPKYDTGEACKAIDKLLAKPIHIMRPELTIDHVAQEYKRAFEETLNRA